MTTRVFDLRAQTRTLPLNPPWGDKEAWHMRAVPVFNGQHHVVFAVDDAHTEADTQLLVAHCGTGRRVQVQKVETADLEDFLRQHHPQGEAEGRRLRDALQTA